MAEFEVINRYEGYRLNHPNFGHVYETTYREKVVTGAKDYGNGNIYLIIGGAEVPVFYHCHRKAELIAGTINLRHGGSGFRVLKDKKDGISIWGYATVAYVRNKPCCVVGFSNKEAQTCCFEPFFGFDDKKWELEYIDTHPEFNPDKRKTVYDGHFVGEGIHAGFSFYVDEWADATGDNPGNPHSSLVLTCKNPKHMNGDPVRGGDYILSSYRDGSMKGDPGYGYFGFGMTDREENWWYDGGKQFFTVGHPEYMEDEYTEIRKQSSLSNNTIIKRAYVIAEAHGGDDYYEPKGSMVKGIVQYLCFEQHPDNISEEEEEEEE